ncbi:MAG: 30S ribosomal protein S12 methylthiotransferase RimO [Candidatus Omnitrophica bacterium]|nr:30S ribosomal protein S12 methylthiotransferase RimO [Candidatus Omnitrophota bacterium]
MRDNLRSEKPLSKIGILSLGCPRNLVDSENILGLVKSKGYPIVDIDKADVAIINTCSFIEEARLESIEAILDLAALKKEGRLKKIIVYGCLPQRYRSILKKELPEVDAFVGRVSFPAYGGIPLGRENHSLDRFAITPRHYAYLKICEGCVNNCSFCVIPKIKGRFSSLDIESLLNKEDEFHKARLAEINIIGQDITGYGMDLYGKPRLAEVLERIVKEVKNIGWIRLLYLYPSRITDELLALIRDYPGVCKYIDLPVQHINDRILKLMRRHTKKQDIIKLIDRIRKTIPGVFLRTSIIVGFPSETDKEFRELVRFIEEARFESLGAFIYSREEGTKAFNLKVQMPKKVKIERFNLVMSLQQQVSQDINKNLQGRTLDVLIDQKSQDYYLGRTQYDAPEVDGQVFVNSERKLKAGDFVRVKITDTLEYDLVGEAV